jgi:hypothetical protein
VILAQDVKEEGTEKVEGAAEKVEGAAKKVESAVEAKLPEKKDDKAQ